MKKTMTSFFDVIVVTAANEAQAKGYREQLAWRKARGYFPSETQLVVISDPGGRRVGSLGATLNVFAELSKSRKDPFSGRRILICHSGGDSRRTPAYAAMGKAFTPLPCKTDGDRPLALFDLIVRNAAELPARKGGQVLILAGDVLLTFNPVSADFSKPGLTGVAWYDTTERGSRHGVYVAEDSKGTCRAVVDFLQKPTPEAAAHAGAVSPHGLVAVDTGIMSLDPALSKKMLAFAVKEALWLKKAPCLDLYEQFTLAVLGRGDKKLVSAFSGNPFNVNVLDKCEFFHIGSSRELISEISTPSATSKANSFVRCLNCEGFIPAKSFANNAVIEKQISSKESLIEGSWLSAKVSLGKNCILTGIPKECAVKIELADDCSLVCLPIGKDKWSAVSYRIDDNFKADGKWDAKLWIVGSVDDVVTHALEVLNGKASGTHSLCELIPEVNHSRMLEVRNEILREVSRARVERAVAGDYKAPSKPPRAAILKDQVVWVTSPVRIDLSGGWSDTPPICLEEGGAVVNAAVTLNGQFPIQVMAKLSDSPRIRVSSIDLGASREFTNSAEILDHSDPHDWCAITKAALVLTGIVPGKKEASLANWLKALGGGLDITIFSALPKGSGMGTSSILGSAVLACLERVIGLEFNESRLIHLTSILEQRMRTGGGWQDQIGGSLGGIKFITTKPGNDQTPAIKKLKVHERIKNDVLSRSLLYFTGQKRMARNILNNVVSRYVSRSGGILEIVAALKKSATQIAACAESGNVKGFTDEINCYWELKKAIDPGSTNEGIEEILKRVKSEACACLLPGAGGGGFVLMIAKNPAAAKRIRKNLESNPPNESSRFFDFTVDEGGLKVTVL